ncbi:glycosyltransferase family 4 protein [Bacteroides pyogenes]|uniref:glycosyltransferase family 4 protein n=1 Tax=Bacteroides pyogenes TaxID=310300 RepID=UPI002A90B8D8|nr:glycosyltransferase family 4 protein [Bacteroides pyogenes]MDY5432742.1 glycosyltransferase family 4 protein [Bacteroides pyogenes]
MGNNRVLVLSNNFGGLHSFRKEVFQAIRDKGYEVIISSPIEDNQEKADWFKNIGCKIIDTQFNRKGTNPIADFKLMLTYRKLIKEIKPFVVLSYTIKPNLYGGMACGLCGVPQLSNITGLGGAVENPGLMQKITILLYKLGFRKITCTFFQNDANRQFCLEHGMVKGRSRLIPGSGVNLEYHIEKPYPLENDPIRFLFISRIRREKGIDEYLAAAEDLKFKYPNLEFHVIGFCEGEYEERLRNLNDKGIIVFHGKQFDVRPFIEQSNCLVHPTFYPEGMSNVLLEACAAGRPIITTDRPGCCEIVDNEVNGFIVKQQNKQDCIEKIEKFIKLPYEIKKTMGTAARKKVEKEFDRKIVVKAYLEEIEKLG